MLYTVHNSPKDCWMDIVKSSPFFTKGFAEAEKVGGKNPRKFWRLFAKGF